jgi:hypothetical protein
MHDHRRACVSPSERRAHGLLLRWRDEHTPSPVIQKAVLLQIGFIEGALGQIPQVSRRNRVLPRLLRLTDHGKQVRDACLARQLADMNLHLKREGLLVLLTMVVSTMQVLLPVRGRQAASGTKCSPRIMEYPENIDPTFMVAPCPLINQCQWFVAELQFHHATFPLDKKPKSAWTGPNAARVPRWSPQAWLGVL